MPSPGNKSEKIRSVNSQITDAITQSNTMLTGMAPAHSLSALYQTLSQSMGTAFQNSVSNQQHINSISLASLAQNVQLILQPKQTQATPQTLPPIIIENWSSGETRKRKRKVRARSPKSTSA
ncbi:RebB family R body protein [Sneathiella limimaris]|uniref:RebB family R body protein n=1 Tax=Sneathiella limimaris TaxID=1964213 RepID=UPI00146C3898|nr:RebB family R body protein [Sneathiella limimaris]